MRPNRTTKRNRKRTITKNRKRRGGECNCNKTNKKSIFNI